jgi:hypothetical protein
MTATMTMKKSKKTGKARKSSTPEYSREYNVESLREHLGRRNAPPDLYIPETRMIPIGELAVDHKYQRELSKNHVMKMLKDFDSSGIGLLYVARRKDGSHWVVDGQQRLQLVKYLNMVFPERFQKVPCEVFESDGKEHEAMLYKLRNHKKKMSALDIFKARYVYGDIDALAILRTCNQKGVKIRGIPMVERPDGNHVQVACVGAIETGYMMGKKIGKANFVLENAINSIKECWGLEASSFKNFMIEGLSLLFSTYPDADMELIKKCMDGKTPNGIKSAVDTTSGFNRSKNVANYIIKEFNKKAKGNKRLNEIEI